MSAKISNLDSPWVYDGCPVLDSDIDISDYEGFVYLITNHDNGLKYIGKKTLWNNRKVKVEKKNGTGTMNRRVKKESDWKRYWGSNKYLKEDAKTLEYNDKKLTREILYFFETKSEANYVEAKLQFQYNVLLEPEKWYNRWIMLKVTSAHLTKCDMTKHKF